MFDYQRVTCKHMAHHGTSWHFVSLPMAIIRLWTLQHPFLLGFQDLQVPTETSASPAVHHLLEPDPEMEHPL